MRHLVKIGFPCHTVSVRPGLGVYVRHVTTSWSQHRMSVVWVLGENLIFFPLSAYSPTPKATRNNLKPSSPVCNLHAT
jgi:hypothetical protein